MFLAFTLVLYLMASVVVESSPAPPMHKPVLQHFTANMDKLSTEVNETEEFLDRQIPNDLIYDLAGRMRLLTRDASTDKYNVFTVYIGDYNVPYIVDPFTGGMYVVQHSTVKRGPGPELYIYKMAQGKNGEPAVYNWMKDRVDQITVNRFGEVKLIPTEGDDSKEERTKLPFE